MISYALWRKWVHKFAERICIHETCSGQMSAHCWSEREPYAPFLSGDGKSGSKPCCIFNESLTSPVPLSHCPSCQRLPHPHLHGTHRESGEYHWASPKSECHPTHPTWKQIPFAVCRCQSPIAGNGTQANLVKHSLCSIYNGSVSSVAFNWFV